MSDVMLLFKRRILGAKLETTVGTAISLSGTDATFNVYNLTFQPNIQFNQRERQTSFSPLFGVLGPRTGTCKFSVDLGGDGAGGVPAWASTFLPPCGFVVSTQTYSPQTNAPGVGGVKTLTLGGYQDGIYKQIHGAMGTFVITCAAGMPIMVEFTFTGVWDAVTDVALVAPTSTVVPPLTFRSSALALGSWATPRVANLTIDAGNGVIMREDSLNASGYLCATITSRRIVGKIDPEARHVADNSGNSDVDGKFLANAQIAAGMTLGATNNQVVFSMPAMQFTNVQEADRNKVQINQIDYQLNGNSSAGDDELTILFA